MPGIYEEKYLKYKKKYLEIEYELGGCRQDPLLDPPGVQKGPPNSPNS